MEGWLTENWFNLFSSAGIIGGLWFTAVSLRSETKTRRIANLLVINGNYREIWRELFRRPELSRVLDASADVKAQPVTPEEELFINLVISRINRVFYTMDDDLVVKLEGSRKDMAEFFSRPVAKPLQNRDFAEFMESAMK